MHGIAPATTLNRAILSLAWLAFAFGLGWCEDRSECTGPFAPYGLAVDAASNLYVAAGGQNRVLKVTPSGTVTTLAGDGSSRYPIYSGDGGPAVSARLAFPFGVAVDASGNTYIADTHNNAIRKVDANGTITTLVGPGSDNPGDSPPTIRVQLDQPSGVAVDLSGNLYIADFHNCMLRKLSGDGVLTRPGGVAMDAAGNLYIADSGHCAIHKIAVDGTTTTIRGKVPGEEMGKEGPSRLPSQ